MMTESPLTAASSRLRRGRVGSLTAGLALGLLVGTAAQAQQPDSTLDMGTLELDTIVVSASGYQQTLEDAPASITVVPRERLEERAFHDVTDALQDIPGVVVTGGGSKSDISIRGMAAKYTMILVDGKRQNSRETRPNSDGPGIEQGWLPPLAAIERIEVIRGPMSSLYGSDAMGGVINIITRKVPEQWTASIRSEATVQEDSDSGNGYQTRFWAAGPLLDDVLGLQVYGQKQHRSEDHILDGFNKQNLNSGGVKLAFSPNEENDFIAEFARTQQERIATPGKSSDLIGRGGQPNTVSSTTYYKNRYALTHMGNWGFGNSKSYIQREDVDNPSRDMYLKNTAVNTQWTLPLGDHILTAGAHYQNEQLEDLGNEFDSDVTQLERYQWALFAEDEWYLTDAFSLTSGLRMTQDELYGTHWTPRLYGVWHATEQFTLKGGVSTGFRAPSLRAAVPDWGQITGGRNSAVPAIIMGNPDLKPEKSITEEIGVVWNNQEGLVTSLTLYHTKFKDKLTEVRNCVDPNDLPTCHVVPGDQGYKFVGERINVDKATIYGAEATLTWRIRDDLRLAANYTYTHSKQNTGEFSGQPLNKMPKHMANVTLDWDATEQLDLWSRINFRGETSDYLSRTSIKDGTPSYTFVDAGANYKINDHLSTGVAVYNMLNKRLPYDDFGATHDGRRYWAHLTLDF